MKNGNRENVGVKKEDYTFKTAEINESVNTLINDDSLKPLFERLSTK